METERMPPRKWRWELWSERPPIVIGPFRANLLKELDSWPGLGYAMLSRLSCTSHSAGGGGGGCTHAGLVTAGVDVPQEAAPQSIHGWQYAGAGAGAGGGGGHG